jgi:cold shock protein
MPSDQLLKCAECGVTFAWTVYEQTPSTLQPARCPACRLLAPANGRQRGVVKWFSRNRGYGFITPGVGPDLFVHKSGLAAGQTPLRAGQLVEFTQVIAGRGAQAEQVQALEEPGGDGGTTE